MWDNGELNGCTWDGSNGCQCTNANGNGVGDINNNNQCDDGEGCWGYDNCPGGWNGEANCRTRHGVPDAYASCSFPSPGYCFECSLENPAKISADNGAECAASCSGVYIPCGETITVTNCESGCATCTPAVCGPGISCPTHQYCDGGECIESDYCFRAGTQVLLPDGSSKNIESIVLGEMVLAHSQDDQDHKNNLKNPEFLSAQVVDVISHEGEHVMHKLELENGNVLEATAEHPIWIVGLGWTPIRKVEIGQVVYKVIEGQLAPLAVVKKSNYGFSGTVYNLTVDGVHNFFADDILVHNKVRNNDF
jgi:hypothetical protein